MVLKEIIIKTIHIDNWWVRVKKEQSNYINNETTSGAPMHERQFLAHKEHGIFHGPVDQHKLISQLDKWNIYVQILT